PPPVLGGVAAAGVAAAVGEAHVGAELAVLELHGAAHRRRAGGGRERARAQRPLRVHRPEAVVAPGDVVERVDDGLGKLPSHAPTLPQSRIAARLASRSWHSTTRRLTASSSGRSYTRSHV